MNDMEICTQEVEQVIRSYNRPNHMERVSEQPKHFPQTEQFDINHSTVLK